MRKSIAVELAAVPAEGCFCLDEPALKTKQLSERDAMAGFVSLPLELVDARLCRRIINRSGGRQPGPGWTTSVQDRRFRDVVSLRRLCPEAIGVLETVVKCHHRLRNV